MKRVVSPALMLNVFQLMTARSVDCVIVVVEPCVEIDAEPPTTWPPCGLEWAGTRPNGTSAEVASRTVRSVRP